MEVMFHLGSSASSAIIHNSSLVVTDTFQHRYYKSACTMQHIHSKYSAHTGSRTVHASVALIVNSCHLYS